jgi:DNA invertase Pin-like site-specific DNA recombinase
VIYGYIRVSTKEQNEDRQLIALSECALAIDKIYLDKQSGKDFNRTEYKKMMAKIRKGDIIVIKSIDRLGRNYNEILEQWRKITKTRGADVVVLDMPLLDTTQSKDLLGTLISDLVLELLSYVSENERVNIKQRQAEGIAAARAKGIKFGRERQYNPDDYLHIYKRVKYGKLKAKDAIKLMGVSESTYHRMKKEWEKRLSEKEQ